MDIDDLPVGTLLSRREALALLGVTGLATLTGCKPARQSAVAASTSAASNPSCVVRPEQTEGPYYVDPRLERADIRADPANGNVKTGAPLELAFVVSQVSGGRCTPVQGARVDLWQCDADGVYSGVRDPSFDTSGLLFLRGYQITDASGTARFATIYPGWYRGRCVHCHFKVRTNAASGRGHEFTSQVYFDDALTDRVHAAAPYANGSSQQRTRNSQDGIFRRSGGEQLLLDVTESGGRYASTFHLGLDLG